MPTVPDQLDLDACRAAIDDLVAAGDTSGAEELLHDAVARWPDALGLRLRLARSIKSRGERDEARALLAQGLQGRNAVPQWATDAVRYFGFVIVAGVLLDIDDPAINGFMRRVLATGDYEATEVEFLADVLRPDDVVLEIGSGIGFLSTFAASTAPTARIVSYEANPALIPVIERTRELNGVDFEVHNAMLGPKDGTADFFLNRAFWASSATHDYGGAEVISVPMVSAAAVMAENDFGLVIMDIEGGEIELLPQLDLDGVDRLVLETHPQITGERAVRKLLRQLRRRHGLVSTRSRDGVHLLVR